MTLPRQIAFLASAIMMMVMVLQGCGSKDQTCEFDGKAKKDLSATLVREKDSVVFQLQKLVCSKNRTYTLDDIRKTFQATDWAYASKAATCEQLLGDSDNTLLQLSTESHLTVLCNIMQTGNTATWPSTIHTQTGTGGSVNLPLPNAQYGASGLRGPSLGQGVLSAG